MANLDTYTAERCICFEILRYTTRRVDNGKFFFVCRLYFCANFIFDALFYYCAKIERAGNEAHAHTHTHTQTKAVPMCRPRKKEMSDDKMNNDK